MESKPLSVYKIMLTKIWSRYEGLTMYELLFKANFELLTGNEISEIDKNYIVNWFLSGKSNEEVVKRFQRSVTRINNGKGKDMYPLFFVPPYDNGRKYVTVSTVTPKTHILSANSYELEILRLLFLFAPENDQVQEIITKTRERLLKTCYGWFCEKGECFETSIIVLRFVGTVFPYEIDWMNQLVKGINKHLFKKTRHSGVVFYYWLTLSELPIGIAKPEIQRFISPDKTTKGKFWLNRLIKRSYVMNSDHDKYASLFEAYVIRNTISRLDKYSDCRSYVPYILEKDRRLHLQ